MQFEQEGECYKGECSKIHCLCRKEPNCEDLNPDESGSGDGDGSGDGPGEGGEEDKGKNKDKSKNKDKNKEKDKKKKLIPIKN